jgi:hypothetical protein
MVKKIKKFLKNNKILLEGLRFLAIYIVFLNVAKYVTVIYEEGFLSKNIFSIAVIGIVLIYRFLSYAFVPAMIFVLIFGILGNRKEVIIRRSK